MNSEPQDRPHRPHLRSDLTALLDAAGGSEPVSRQELAAATAAAVVTAGRGPGDDGRFVALADQIGLDTLAELWSDAEPVSLPGALWALYTLRQWCRSDGAEVTRLWRAGEPFAPASAVIAGVHDTADVAAVHQVADAVLGGVYHGDLAVALERAAALFHVIAAGRRQSASDGERGEDERALAERNDRVAADLSAAARRWREGTLR